MKKLCLLLIPIVFSALFMKTLSQGTWKLNVNISHGVQKGMGYVWYWDDKGPFDDSARITNGKFTITGKVPGKPTIARVYYRAQDESSPKPETSAEVFLEQGTIIIAVNKNFYDAKYSGTILQKQFSELHRNLVPVKKKEQVLNLQYGKAVQNKDDAVRDKLLNEGYPSLFAETQKILGAFIRKYSA